MSVEVDNTGVLVFLIIVLAMMLFGVGCHTGPRYVTDCCEVRPASRVTPDSGVGYAYQCEQGEFQFRVS